MAFSRKPTAFIRFFRSGSGEVIAFKSAQRLAMPTDGVACWILRLADRVMAKSVTSLGTLLPTALDHGKLQAASSKPGDLKLTPHFGVFGEHRWLPWQRHTYDTTTPLLAHKELTRLK